MAKDKVRGKKSKKEKSTEKESHGSVVVEVEEPVQQVANIDQQIQTPFFGLVDSNELDYFKTAESTLNINAFESPEERAIFINSVIEESQGKELKLATNQICSKLVERLILNSSDQQLKHFFKVFSGHFASLSHHKYASHCIETLLVRAAALVEKEMLNPNSVAEQEQEEEGFASMENMLFYMIGELKPFLKEMVQHQYASHVLRLIILILSGRELPSSIESNSLLRSKKSKIARKMIEIKDNQDFNRKFQIPTTFFDELKSILDILLVGQDTKTLREACINSVSSPTYSLILSIEGLVLKDRPFWDIVFSKQDSEKDSKEEAFIEYCLSDPVGSHFLENVLKQARAKNLERIFAFYIKERVLKIAKREKTGSFIIQVLLQRLKSDSLFNMLNELIANLDQLIENQELIKKIIDTSIARKNYKKQEIVAQLAKTYPKETFLESVLKLSSSTLGNTRDDWPTSEERKNSLFLEKLFDFDELFIHQAIDNLLSLESNKILLDMCQHGVFSHIIEQILINFQKIEIITRRKILNQFLEKEENIVQLTCNSNGSHIVDKLWLFTVKLNNYKERISNIFVQNKDTIKNSTYGKLVWKNWHMDLYLRKKFDWKGLIRDQELEYFPPLAPKESTADEDAKKRKSNEASNGNFKKVRV